MISLKRPEDVASALPRVRAHLAANGVLAYPTETVYGLGTTPRADALHELIRLKGRVPDKPFLLLISGRRMAEEHGLVFSPSADALANTFWPGPLTLVLSGGEGRLPDELRGPEGGIAVRHTGHPLMADLLAGLGMPITSTSANRPGSPPSPGPDRIAEVFAEEIEDGRLLLLDGGVLGNVPPSTIVDCTHPIPRMIRDGAIPRAELRRAAGRLAP